MDGSCLTPFRHGLVAHAGVLVLKCVTVDCRLGFERAGDTRAFLTVVWVSKGQETHAEINCRLWIEGTRGAF